MNRLDDSVIFRVRGMIDGNEGIWPADALLLLNEIDRLRSLCREAFVSRDVEILREEYEEVFPPDLQED